MSQRDEFAATSMLTAPEVDELRRAAAVGPLDPADVRRMVESHREVLAERAELVAQLQRLTPAWGKLKAVLNELNAVLVSDGASRPRLIPTTDADRVDRPSRCQESPSSEGESQRDQEQACPGR